MLSIRKNKLVYCLTIVRTYSGDLAGTPVPARWNSCSGSLELLFRLAGTPVPARWNSCFLIRFSGSKNI
jgi:hypothetical protein